MNDQRPTDRATADRRRAVGPKKLPAPDAKQTPSTKTIEIKLSVPAIKAHPKLRKVKQWISGLSQRQKAGLIIAAVLLIATGIFLMSSGRQLNGAEVTQSGPKNPLDQLEKGTPDYPTVIPSNKSVESLGWRKVSPKGIDPVYAYPDRIGAIPISVAQQPLPSTFKENPESGVRNLALANNAAKTISVDGNTVHLTSSAKGPQRVFFRKGETLVLITATAQIDDDAWKKYIQSLG